MLPENKSIHEAILEISRQGYDIHGLLSTKAIKAFGDFEETRADYNDTIVQAIIDYASGDKRIDVARNLFRRAMATAFVDAFDTGYVDGGGEMPVPDDDLEWLASRQEQEFQYVADLFQTLKQKLKDDPQFDYFSWATERADGYTRTLDGIFSQGKLRAQKDKMLTFDGDDGNESCVDCQRWKGQRHRASWWIAKDLIPYPGNSNFECRGYRCQHGLIDDDGNWFTR